jgi:2-dehydropantoate 2-reductase
MRIAIVGAGGAGGYFGACLARAGEDVVFIARGEHLDAIRQHGLQIDSIHGDFKVSPAKATDNPEQIGPVDMVLLGVKAWQVRGIIKDIRPLVGPESVIIPIQNGVEASTQLAAGLGSEHVLGGLAKIISYKIGPGHIKHLGAQPYIAIGELDKQPSKRIEWIRQVFQKSGISIDISMDIQAALWEKFLFVVSWGGVGAVANAPIGVVCDVPETRWMLEQSMNEVLSVAQARKIILQDDIVKKTLKFIDSLPANGTTSLQRDILEGKPSELSFWNGAVVRLGQEVSVSTPINTIIYSSLLPRELQARGKIQFPE